MYATSARAFSRGLIPSTSCELISADRLPKARPAHSPVLDFPRHVRATGVKKGHLVEQALRHHLEALQELPTDVIVHPKIVVSRKSRDALLKEIEKGNANDALRALMRDGRFHPARPGRGTVRRAASADSHVPFDARGPGCTRPPRIDRGTVPSCLTGWRGRQVALGIIERSGRRRFTRPWPGPRAERLPPACRAGSAWCRSGSRRAGRGADRLAQYAWRR